MYREQLAQDQLKAPKVIDASVPMHVQPMIIMNGMAINSVDTIV